MSVLTRKKYASYLLVICCYFALFPQSGFAQDQYKYLLNKTYAERVPLFDTVFFAGVKELDSNAFRKEIELVKELATKESDEGLYMEAILHEWYYSKNHRLYPLEKDIEDLRRLLKVAKEKRQDKYVILLRFELAGQLFYHAHSYKEAFTQYIENFASVTQVSSSEFPNKKSIIVHTANAYYNFGDYVNAKKYLLIADTVRNSWRVRVSIQCKNSLGLVHRTNKQYDSAVYYFNQCIDIAKKHNRDIWVSIASGNIGICYYEQALYKEAVPLLKLDAYTCLKKGSKQDSYDNGINSLIKLANAYIAVNKLDSAEISLNIIEHFIDSTKDKAKHMPGYYAAQAKFLIANGKYKQAHLYRDSADIFRKSLQERDNIIQLARVQSRIRQEVHDKEIEKLSIEKELISTVRNGLLVGLILLAIITYLIINRQKTKHNTKQKLLLFEKQIAETNLENASSQLERFTKSFQEKNLLIEKSAEEIRSLQKSLKDLGNKQNANLIIQQLYESTILTDDEWEEFRRLFEQVHGGYITRLKEKYPSLSPADVRFVVLSKLKLSNKEMAGILGVQPDSMRTYKYRLRKKFNISDEEQLLSIIDSI